MAKSKWTVDRTKFRQRDLTILGDPVWLRLREELSVGEDRGVKNAAFKGVTGFGTDEPTEIAIDWKRSSFARTMAWLLDWNLQDADGNKLPLTLESVQDMHEAVYDPIEAEINKHIEAMTAEKKSQAGEPVPPAMST